MTTWKDVKKRMKKMGVEGWSSMAEYTPNEIMVHLDEIQRLIDNRCRVVEEVLITKKRKKDKRKK